MKIKNIIAAYIILQANLFAGEEGYGLVIVPSAPVDKDIDSLGSQCSDFGVERTKQFLPKLLTKIKHSKKATLLFEENEDLTTLWNKYHDSFLRLQTYENPYGDTKFYKEFSKVMVETHGFQKFRAEVGVYIHKKNKNTHRDFLNKNSVNPTEIFKEDCAYILLSSWRKEESLKVTLGLVKSELIWTLIHHKSIYDGYIPASAEQKDWEVWGGTDQALTRGLICNPSEVIEVLSNNDILNLLDAKLISTIPKITTEVLSLPIGQRQGVFLDGKYINPSPEIEKRRKIAKEKYLPQINKIIADYLKDKKADK